MSAVRGRFITLEGGEGAGKSTQAARLAAHLRAQGREVVLTREPGGSPAAERIRALLLSGDGFDPLAEAMLHAAARADHVATVVAPALERGADVVCDRFTDSTMAYQHYGQGAPADAILTLRELIRQRPDRTLVLDVPPGIAAARMAGRAGDRYERLGPDFHARVRQGFRVIAETDPARCTLIDASQNPDTVFAAILAAIGPPAMPHGVWSITETSDEAVRAAVAAGLSAYNVAAVGYDDEAPLLLAARDASGRLIGGLSGTSYWGWLFIAMLWIAEPYRAQGLGRALLSAAEAAATRRGCHGVRLDSFSFQAPGFYARQGYEEFGRIDAYPAPHTRHWMRKILPSASASPSPARGRGPG